MSFYSEGLIHCGKFALRNGLGQLIILLEYICVSVLFLLCFIFYKRAGAAPDEGNFQV